MPVGMKLMNHQERIPGGEHDLGSCQRHRETARIPEHRQMARLWRLLGSTSLSVKASIIEFRPGIYVISGVR